MTEFLPAEAGGKERIGEWTLKLGQKIFDNWSDEYYE